MSKRTIRSQSKKKSADESNNKSLILAVVVAAVVMLIAIVLVIVESSMRGKIKVTNDSQKSIEMLKVYFEDSEEVDSEPIFEMGIASGKTETSSFDKQKLAGSEHILCFEVTYEGEKEPVWFYDGDFVTDFEGYIKLRFYTEDGEDCMYAKASEGLFGTTKRTDVDTDFYIYPEENDWNYKY